MFLTNTNNNSSTIALVIFLVVIGAVLILVIVLAIYNGVQNKKVEQSSPFLNKLKEINSRYNFSTISPKQDRKVFHLNSKRQFDNFDYVRKCDAYVKEYSYKYSPMVEKAERNKRLLVTYKEEIKQAKQLTTRDIVAATNMKYESFIKREDKLASKMYKNPDVLFSIYFEWEYTSPAGRNHYSYHCTYGYDSVKRLVVVPTRDVYKDIFKPKTTPTPKPRSETKAATLDDIEDLD